MEIPIGSIVTVRSPKGTHRAAVRHVDQTEGLVYLLFLEHRDRRRFHDDYRNPNMLFRTLRIAALEACSVNPGT